MINHSEGLKKELIKTCFDNLKGAAYFLIMVNDLTDGRIALLFADDTTAVPGVIVLSRL